METRGMPPIARKPRYHGGPVHLRGLSHCWRRWKPRWIEAVANTTGCCRHVPMSFTRCELESPRVVCRAPMDLPVIDHVEMEAGAEHYRFRQHHPDDLDHDAVIRNDSATLSLGRVNAYHERMKTLVNRRARGVSTPLLENYLTWLRLVRQPFGAAPEVLRAVLSPT